MTTVTDALSLLDRAAGIERLRFELRTVPDTPAPAAQAGLARHIRTLSGLIGQVGKDLSKHLHRQWPAPSQDRTAQAFEAVLVPLDAAQSELIRALQLASPKEAPRATVEQAAAHLLRNRLWEADAVLQRAAQGLRAAADDLVPAPPRRQDAALARSPRTAAAALPVTVPGAFTTTGPEPSPARTR